MDVTVHHNPYVADYGPAIWPAVVGGILVVLGIICLVLFLLAPMPTDNQPISDPSLGLISLGLVGLALGGMMGAHIHEQDDKWQRVEAEYLLTGAVDQVFHDLPIAGPTTLSPDLKHAQFFVSDPHGSHVVVVDRVADPTPTTTILHLTWQGVGQAS